MSECAGRPQRIRMERWSVSVGSAFLFFFLFKLFLCWVRGNMGAHVCFYGVCVWCMCVEVVGDKCMRCVMRMCGWNV